MVRHFRELIVWQKAMDLVAETYQLTRLLPDAEQFGLISQMRRAAVSIPSNIAEGQSRLSTKDFVHFLCIARGSNAELQTQCEICIRLSYIQPGQAGSLLDLSAGIGRMLNKLIQTLQTQPKPSHPAP